LQLHITFRGPLAPPAGFTPAGGVGPEGADPPVGKTSYLRPVVQLTSARLEERAT